VGWRGGGCPRERSASSRAFLELLDGSAEVDWVHHLACAVPNKVCDEPGSHAGGVHEVPKEVPAGTPTWADQGGEKKKKSSGPWTLGVSSVVPIFIRCFWALTFSTQAVDSQWQPGGMVLWVPWPEESTVPRGSLERIYVHPIGIGGPTFLPLLGRFASLTPDEQKACPALQQRSGATKPPATGAACLRNP